ncbi:MAG: hypothetical protein Q9213_001391 [Squamulea squamosa]
MASDSGAFRHGWSAAETRSQPLNHLARKHLARLVAALTDFHKAQCFFMMAINIAALVVIRRGGFDPQSLQQIYDTYVFLQVLAINGFLPITFTLTNLYLVGLLSWFLVLLSTVTVVLSTATLASVGRFDPSEAETNNLAMVAATGGPPECDGKKPGVYCFQTMHYQSQWEYFYGGQDVPNYAYRILGFCLVNLALLVGHQLRFKDQAVVAVFGSFARRIRASLRSLGVRVTATQTFLILEKAALIHWEHTSQPFALYRQTLPFARSHPWVSAQISKIKTTRAWRFSSESAVQIQQQLRAYGWQSSLGLALRMAVYIVFLTFYVRFYNMFLHDLAWFAKNDVIGNEWNFGQVFAITVWAPPVIEYIHLEMRGMQRAFDYRLLPPFRVLREVNVKHDLDVHPIDIWPKSQEQHDLERGKDLAVHELSPIQHALPSPTKDDDNDATFTQYHDDVSGYDIVDEEQRNKFHDHPTEPDSIIPLRSHDENGTVEQDEERLLPALDLSPSWSPLASNTSTFSNMRI